MFSRRRASLTTSSGIQLVGRKIFKSSAFPTGENSVSLTDLAGGLATQPSTNDFIAVGFGTVDSADRDLGIKTAALSDYTLVGSEIALNDVYDTNFRVAYAFAGGTPDTSLSLSSSRGTTGLTAIGLISVWRGVNLTTPLDVAATSNSGTDTGKVNPAAITPTTAGSIIQVFGVGTTNTDGSPALFTSGDLTDFQTDAGASTTANMMGGMGYHEWVSGAFDPTEWGNGSTNVNDTWASITMALRPA